MNSIIRLANWFMRIYLDTPSALRWIYFVLPLAYFIFPLDLDFLGIFGRIDDILLLLFVFWAMDRAQNFKDFHKEARGQKKQTHTETGKVHRPPHEVLGVSRNAGKSEIKQAYRKLMAQYHPDKFSHLGEAFEATAVRRSQEINEAYKQMMG